MFQAPQRSTPKEGSWQSRDNEQQNHGGLLGIHLEDVAPDSRHNGNQYLQVDLVPSKGVPERNLHAGNVLVRNKRI